MLSHKTLTALVMCCLILSTISASAQQAETRPYTISVFIDCDFCDFDHIRQEIIWVNYARNSHDADVHVLISSEATGSGGSKVNLFLIGRHEFLGKSDTLYYYLAPDDTEEIQRSLLLRYLRIGLLPFLKNSPMLRYANVELTLPDTSSETPGKWDDWVFRVNTSGNINSNKNYLSYSISSSLSADRITEKFKTESSFSHNFSESKYRSEDYNYRSINRSYSFFHRDVFSLNKHWSAGFWLGANSSTYSNLRFKTYLNPAIEYNLFPYSESSRRQLRMSYTVGPMYNTYHDSTIYGKTEELLFRHSLNVSTEFVQSWGRVWLNTSYANYLHDFSLNRLSFNSSVSLRIARGLELTMMSYFSLIHDQIALPKGEATPEEILLQQRELKTSYSFYLYGGLTYTFGNRYNNVVNPRFS